MKLLCGVLLFIGVFTLSNATNKIIVTQQFLERLLKNSLAFNPANIEQCTQDYHAKADAAGQKLTASNEECTSNAQAMNQIRNDEAAVTQASIKAATEALCGSMTRCSALEGLLEFFDCYTQGGEGNLESLRVVTNNAKEIAEHLRQEYSFVEHELEKCLNAADQAIKADVTKASEEYILCLENGPPAASEEPAPEEPAPEEPAPEEPAPEEPAPEEPAPEEPAPEEPAPEEPAPEEPPPEF